MNLWKLMIVVLSCPVSAVIQGLSWYGLETPRRGLTCDWSNPMEHYLKELYGMGFRSLRIPFSWEFASANDDSFFIAMDHIFDEVTKYPGMNIVLDCHRIFSSHQGPEPEEWYVTMDMFIDMWKRVISRYIDRPQLLAIEPFNEFQTNDPQYVNTKLTHIITQLEDAFPNRLTFYAGGCRWGGSLNGISLEHLPYAKERIRYVWHKYLFSSGDNWVNDWDWSLGEIAINEPHRIIIGEYGWITEDPSDHEWALRLVEYLKQRGIRDSYLWTLGHSSDTHALYYDDCNTVDWDKLSIVQSLWL